MIQFFRKIRQTLLTQNRFNTYLVYAFGEIILVVIGILIALQINTWNEHRKEQIKSVEFHERIIEDLNILINDLDRDVKRATKVSTYLNAGLRILKSGELSLKDKDSLDYVFKNYYQFVRLEDNLKSIEELKSSGQFGLIYKKELRESIDKFTTYLAVISKIYDQLAEQVNEDDFIHKYVFIQTSEGSITDEVIYNFSELKNDSFLINKLSKFKVNWLTKKEFSSNLLSGSKKLKEQILEELEN